jgi:hypothetical protein
VLARERELFLGQETAQHLHGLLEPVEPFPHRRQFDAVLLMLVALPSGADAEHQPAAADPVDGGRHVRHHRRVPVGVAEHQGADPDPGHERGHRRDGGDRLQDRTGASARHEVVGDVHAVPAGCLGMPCGVEEFVER